MKTVKRIFLLFVLINALSSNAFSQIKLSQSLSPNGSFGLVDVNELKGGLMMVDDLSGRDNIYMNRTKKGMLVMVVDADDAQLGEQPKCYIFMPSDDPVDYNDGGKVWNTYDEFPIHFISQFMTKYGMNPWAEVALSIEGKSAGLASDSLIASVILTDSIFSNTGDTLYLKSSTVVDSLVLEYFNISGVAVQGVSTDASFANASHDSLVSQLAIKDYISNRLQDLESDSTIVSVALVDSIYSNEGDTLFLMSPTAVDSVLLDYLSISGVAVQGVSTDASFANASHDSLVSQLAIKDYISNRLQDLESDSTVASVALVDSIYSNEGDTLFLMSPTAVDSVLLDYLNISGVAVQGVSTDASFANASHDSLVSQLAIKDYISNRLQDLESDSLIAVVALVDSIYSNVGDTLYLMSPTIVDSVLLDYLNVSGVEVHGVSTDTTFLNASNDSLASQLAIKSYIDSRMPFVTTYGDSAFSYIDGNNDTTLVDLSMTQSDKELVDSMIFDGGNDINFAYGTKTITRPGLTGITGTSVDADNLEDFLKKIFFPVSSPLISTFKLGTEADASKYSRQVEDPASKLVTSYKGVDNLAYSSWNTQPAVTLNYSILNRSVRAADASEDTPIDSIVLYINGTRIGANLVSNTTENLNGSFTVNTAELSKNATSALTNSLKLLVYDAYPNVSELDLDVQTAQAVKSYVHSSVTASDISSAEGSNPYLIERDGNAKEFTVTYRVYSRDETVTDVEFIPVGGIAAPANLSGLSISADNVYQNATISIENSNLSQVRLGVRVKGDIYNSFSATRYSPYIQLADRGYVGYISNEQRLDIENQGGVITSFNNAYCKLNYQFKETGGVSLTNDIGGIGFICFAIPASKEGEGKNFGIQTYDLGVWSDAAATQVKYDITTNGATVSYYVIYSEVTTGNGSATTARVVLK